MFLSHARVAKHGVQRQVRNRAAENFDLFVTSHFSPFWSWLALIVRMAQQSVDELLEHRTAVDQA